MSRLCGFDDEPTLKEWLEGLREKGIIHNAIPAALTTKYLPKVVLDIGTRNGDSAYKIGRAGAQKVLTFDIADCGYHHPDDAPVVRHIADLCKPEVAEQFADDIAQCTLVFLDVDPHDGQQEPKIVENLRRHQRQDIILVCDDIDMTPGMRTFWSGLDAEQKISLPWAQSGSGFGVAILRRPE